MEFYRNGGHSIRVALISETNRVYNDKGLLREGLPAYNGEYAVMIRASYDLLSNIFLDGLDCLNKSRSPLINGLCIISTVETSLL